ncbi:MAG: tetratricopeptide repeat protein [Cyclobacteriaceae bacterium]|nr:tetratricopeptide repeat protein [Cyclobacteriaceae bacterium]
MLHSRYFIFFILLLICFSCQNQDSVKGDKYFEQGKYEEAIASYTAYLELNPRHVKSIYNRGRSHQELGQYDKAIEDFNHVVQLDSKNENALLSISQDFYRKGEYESAGYYAEKVIEYDSNNAMAYYMLGRSHNKRSLFRAALNDFNTAIRLDPELGEAYLHRGALKLTMKQKAQACVDLQKAASMNVEGAADAYQKNCK